MVYYNAITVYHHHHSSSFHQEHRAATVSFHRSRSRAICFASSYNMRMALSSASRILRHVVTGLPLLRLPWGFYSRAWRVILGRFLRGVCPNNLHLCPTFYALRQSSWFDIRTGHRVCRICLRQLLTKTCNLCSNFFVCLHVCAP